MHFIVRETHIFLLNLGQFSHGEKRCSEPTEWNLNFYQGYVIFFFFLRKNGTSCDQHNRYISLFLKCFWRFLLNPRLSLVSLICSIMKTSSFWSAWSDAFEHRSVMGHYTDQFKLKVTVVKLNYEQWRFHHC